MKIVALMKFNPELCDGLASELERRGITFEVDKEANVIVDDNTVNGMPEPVEGTVYLVNALVYNSLSSTRDDLAVFDNSKVTRFDSGPKEGLVRCQGGIIFSNGERI